MITYLYIAFIFLSSISLVLTKKNNILILFLQFFIISIILGGRYETGVDWINYIKLFNDVANFGESGFYYFLLSFKMLGLDYWHIISIITIINLFTIIILSWRISPYPSILFTFLIFFQWIYFNENIRQMLATSIVYFGLFILLKKNNFSFYKYVILVIISCFFHSSSVILFSLIIYKFILKRINLILYIYITIFILNVSGLNPLYIFNHIPIENIYYTKFIHYLADDKLELTFGFLFRTIIFLLFLLYYKKIKKNVIGSNINKVSFEITTYFYIIFSLIDVVFLQSVLVRLRFQNTLSPFYFAILTYFIISKFIMLRLVKSSILICYVTLSFYKIITSDIGQSFYNINTNYWLQSKRDIDKNHQYRINKVIEFWNDANEKKQ